MRKHRHLLLLIIVVISVGIAQTTIAVLDFDARGISQNEVATLTDRFRDELIKTNQFIVIERGKMEEVLKEQGFQQSGCTSDECVVEVGQLIGVEQMVGGSIGKVGNVYSVSARMIDIESGTISKVTTYDHVGDIGGLLTAGMRLVAQGLLRSNSNKPSIVNKELAKPIDDTQPGTSDIPKFEFIPYDEPPQPIGGYAAIQSSVRYPDIAREAGIEGTVIVQVFIDKTGKATHTNILKGVPNTGLDKAAIVAIRNTSFQPAKQRDRTVGVWINIPVIFKL